MQLVREYTELIERDSEEISFLWKGLQMLCCFSSAVSGYSCSILFYILWNGLFGGHCPFWGKLDYLSESVHAEDEHLHDYITAVRLNVTDWKRYVVVSYDYESYCEFYHSACFLSCIFGIVWLTMFFMCGKGGYDSRSQESIISTYFEAPWRIVMPAMIFNFCLTVITLHATRIMERGYQQFGKDLTLLFAKIVERQSFQLYYSINTCVILQDFTTLYTVDKYDVCSIFYTLETVSWIMTWSWIAGFMILLVRFITISDFRLLKIRIFNISQNESKEGERERIAAARTE